MYRKPVLERVKEGLSEKILKTFFTPVSNGTGGKPAKMILKDFRHNALSELAQIKTVKRQFSVRIHLHPSHWEHERRRLRQKFSVMVRRVN